MLKQCKNTSLLDLLENYDGTQNMINQCLNVVRSKSEIVIFGAGVGGEQLYKLLHKHGLSEKIKGWSDNNALKFGKPYMENRLLVIPPDDLLNFIGKDEAILISSSAYKEIKQQLISYGFSDAQIYLFNFAFMDLEYTDKDFIYDHKNDFERSYARMMDEKSQKIFVDILNYRITKDEQFLYHMSSYVDDEQYQYFPKDLFDFSSDESFLDIGAYTGDTLESFNKFYKGNWHSYYGFEADPKIYEILQTNIKAYNKEKAKIYNLAAYNEKTNIAFSSWAGSSSVSLAEESQMIRVNADRVDSVLPNVPITFIKMDVEGEEYKVISGMESIIKKNSPILAVCVYHRRDDFFRLTDLIESISPNTYMFYFRQYRFTPTETVCYAIPQNRLLNKLRT